MKIWIRWLLLGIVEHPYRCQFEFLPIHILWSHSHTGDLKKAPASCLGTSTAPTSCSYLREWTSRWRIGQENKFLQGMIILWCKINRNISLNFIVCYPCRNFLSIYQYVTWKYVYLGYICIIYVYDYRNAFKWFYISWQMLTTSNVFLKFGLVLFVCLPLLWDFFIYLQISSSWAIRISFFLVFFLTVFMFALLYASFIVN